MKLMFPFWIGQVDTKSLPPWCGIVLLVTIIVSVIIIAIMIVKRLKYNKQIKENKKIREKIIKNEPLEDEKTSQF